MNVFVSVGSGLSPDQEAFVSAVEGRLKAVGANPCAIGRNTFSTDTPLRAVVDLMDRSSGAVIIALERYSFDNGVERRGSPREQPLGRVFLPTAWNQIEAAMAYGRGLPLLVLVDERLRCDGLLEKGNEWFVYELPIDPASLNASAFTGLLDSWRQRVTDFSKSKTTTKVDPSTMNVAELFKALGVKQLWALLGAVVACLGVAFSAGSTYEKLTNRETSSAPIVSKPQPAPVVSGRAR